MLATDFHLVLYAVWLYLRFTLRYRDVEYLLTERGQEPEVLNVAVLRANLR
jgi:transposase-like protein